ncbi:flavodoxin family protein [Thermodesulfobacteriota bacterium]
MNPKMYIVYSSPAGSTRHIAVVIEKALQRLHANIESLDLKNQIAWPGVQNRITLAEKQACLFIGSPVYRGLAVPPVMSFIKRLGDNHQHYAVPFATWGGSSSGNAL